MSPVNQFTKEEGLNTALKNGFEKKSKKIKKTCFSSIYYTFKYIFGEVLFCSEK